MASEVTTPESHQNYDMEIPEMTKERVPFETLILMEAAVWSLIP